MTWASLILLVLRLVHSLVEAGKKHHWISEGEQRAIAASSLEVTKKVAIGKKILEEVSGLTDAQVDDALRALEPDELPDPKSSKR